MGNRIVPQNNKQIKNLPSWLKVDEILEASKASKQAGIQKIAAKEQSSIAISYACSSCSKVFSVDHPELVKQANLAKRANTDIAYTCPNCGNGMTPYKTTTSLCKRDEIRYADQIEVKKDMEKIASGSYNTYTDRHIQYRAINALEDFATKQGMTAVRARYLRSEHTKQAGQEYPMLNAIACELEWMYGKKQKARVEAFIGIDPAGKFKFPKIFKTADGTEYPFEKEVIQSLEKSADREVFERKMKRTDTSTFKRPDVSRFRAVASLNEVSDDEKIVNSFLEEESSKKTAANIESKKKVEVTSKLAMDTAQPQWQGTPQTFTPNQQVVNPLDNKSYTIKTMNADGSMAVIDPTTNQESIVPKDQAINLKPAVKTAVKTTSKKVVSAEELANDLIREHLHEDKTEALNKVDQHISMAEQDIEGIESDRELMSDLGIEPRGSLVKKYTHMKTMSSRWNEIRKSLKVKSQLEEKSEEEIPIDKLSREVRAARDIGYNLKKPDVDETGHDKKTGLPFNETKDVQVGLTEFPKGQKRDDNYFKNTSERELEENQVRDREHFRNQDLLSVHRMRRDELKDYIEGEDEKNYGLSQAETEELNKIVGDSLGTTSSQKTAADIGIEDIPEGPIQYKKFKKAPPDAGYEEPLVIEPTKGQASEAITKLHKVQEDLVELEKTLKERQAEFVETVKPLTEDIAKKKSISQSYIDMAYNAINSTKDRVSAYEDVIVAAFSKIKLVKPIVSLSQVEARAKAISEELAQKIAEIKTQLEEAGMGKKYERTLYEYPVSKSQEKKIKSSLEDNQFISIVNNLIKSLDSISNQIFEEISNLV